MEKKTAKWLEIVKKNWLFGVFFLVILIVYGKRYIYLTMPIVSHPDGQITFSMENNILEQTWQPTVKAITGISVPYLAEGDFSCKLQMQIFSDDYQKAVIAPIQVEYTFTAGESGNIDFKFRRTPLVLGERYRIQISMSDAPDEGKLQIISGSNYGGCSISGRKIGQAIALTITFAKYSRWFWLISVLLPLLSFSMLFMVLAGKKWEETVGLSLFLEGIILYCFGCLEHLIWGINIIYILSVVSMIIAIALFNIRNIRLKDLLSSGLWIYFVMFAVIIVSSSGDWLGHRDDLRHWGIAVRDMYYYDSFARHAGSTVILPRYLPFTAIIEYIYEYMNGMYSEDILLISYQTMLLSVLIIFCRLLRIKEAKKLAIPVMVTIICVPVIFFNNVSNSIMVDSLLAVVTAYILICYYIDKGSWFGKLRIVCALAALVLIKDVGLILAGMASLVMLGDTFVSQCRKREINIRELFYPIICICFALALYFSWQFYLSTPINNAGNRDNSDNREAEIVELTNTQGLELEKTESENVEITDKTEEERYVETAISASGVTFEGLLKIFWGEGEEYQYLVTRNFIIELFDGETYSLGRLSFSFVDLMIVILFVVVSLGYFGFWRKDKIRVYVFVSLLSGVSACLCCFLQVVYWFSFSIYEAIELTSFKRYLAPYACAVFIVALYLIYEKAGDTGFASAKVKYMVSAIAVFLVISMPVAGIVIEGKDIEDNTTEKITYGHNEIAEILRTVARKGERAFFICSNSDGYSEYVFRHAVCPVVSEHKNWNIVSSQEIYFEQYKLYGKEGIDDNVAQILSIEEWKKELKDCEYLVIFHADELFHKSYSELFKDSEQIEDGSVYQIVKDNEDISFDLIGKTGIKGWH